MDKMKMEKKTEIMFYYLITPLIPCLTANNPNITKEWWFHISSGKSSTKIAKFFLTNRRKIIKLGKVYPELNTFILLRVYENYLNLGWELFCLGNFIIIKNKDILMVDYIEKLRNNFNSKKVGNSKTLCYKILLMLILTPLSEIYIQMWSNLSQIKLFFSYFYFHKKFRNFFNFQIKH